MSDDIARLGIEVDSRQVLEADVALDRIARTASSTDRHVRNLSDTFGNTFRSAIAGLGVGVLAGDILSTNREMESLRAQLTSVTGSIESGKDAFKFIQDFATNTPFEVQGLTRSFVTLRNFGINPTKEVMTAITEQAAKLGGSQETLSRITLSLGQAWAKGKLQGEEIMQLVEAGVPVWELLGQVTGKTAGELQKMSEKGELTRDTISKLISKMGELASGSNAQAMTTLNGSISNLSDAWHQFEDTLLNDKSEGLIKSLVGSVTRELSTLTTYLSSTTDDQVKVLENRVKNYESMGAVGKAVSDYTGYDVNVDKNNLSSLRKQKQIEDEAQKQREVQSKQKADAKLAADNAAQAQADANEKAEKAAKKAAAHAESVAKAEARKREAVARTIETLQQEIDVIGNSNDEQKAAHEIRQLTINATEKEAAAISKLVKAKYDLLDSEQILAEGEKLALQQRKEMVAEEERLRDKFNPGLKELNQGISDVMDAGASGMFGPKGSAQSQARMKDELDKLGQEYNNFTSKAAKDTLNLSAYGEQAAKNIETSFANFLFDPFDKGSKGMLDSFVTVIRRMASEAASAQLMQSLFGTPGKTDGSGLMGSAMSGLGKSFFGSGSASAGQFNGTGPLQSFGGSEGILSSAGSWFSGFFAEGGDNPGGYRVVGENGPELEATGPSRIFNAQQTKDILGGGNGGMLNNVVINVTAAKGESASEVGSKIAESFVRNIARAEIANAARPQNALNRTTKVG